jgi:hypothetical protein
MSAARFRVYGRMDGASSATVTIDRETGTVEVRPYRRHKRQVAVVTLAWLAETALWRAARARAAELPTAKRKGARRAP